MSITIDEQIKSVAREIALRRNVYPKQVANGRLKQDQADYEIRVMESVLRTLSAIKTKRGGDFVIPDADKV